jgi:WD40 repeat protein
MACQFSAPFQFSLKNVCYSPSATLLASASGSNLTIRDATSLEILHTHTCIDKIEHIEFSPDSEYIFCGIFARCAIQVYSVADPKWRCRINESVAGIISASWSPDSRHIIVESDFGIQLAIWSLVENVSYIINSPKTGQSNYAFSDCGRWA